MSPDQLDTALEVANILPCQLPRYRRDPDLVAREAEAARWAQPPGKTGTGSLHAGLGEEFERALAAAKAGTWKPPRPNRKARRAGKQA